MTIRETPPSLERIKPPASRPWWRRPILGGIALLVLLLIAVPIGLKWRVGQQRQTLIAAIESTGGTVNVYDQASTDWRRRLGGFIANGSWPASFVEVRSNVMLMGPQINDEWLAAHPLSVLPSGISVTLWQTLITDEGLAHLRSQPDITSISFAGPSPNLSLDAIFSTMQSHQRGKVTVSYTEITDAQLQAYVKQLSHVQDLQVNGTSVTGKGLVNALPQRLNSNPTVKLDAQQLQEIIDADLLSEFMQQIGGLHVVNRLQLVEGDLPVHYNDIPAMRKHVDSSVAVLDGSLLSQLIEAVQVSSNRNATVRVLSVSSGLHWIGLDGLFADDTWPATLEQLSQTNVQQATVFIEPDSPLRQPLLDIGLKTWPDPPGASALK